jgi:hypothetical protein
VAVQVPRCPPRSALARWGPAIERSSSSEGAPSPAIWREGGETRGGEGRGGGGGGSGGNFFHSSLQTSKSGRTGYNDSPPIPRGRPCAACRHSVHSYALPIILDL